MHRTRRERLCRVPRVTTGHGLWQPRHGGDAIALASGPDVSAPRLTLVCDKLVDALIRRPPYALAFSKRAFNRIYAERFNMLFDIGYAYEMMNKEQHGRYEDGRGEKTL